MLSIIKEHSHRLYTEWRQNSIFILYITRCILQWIQKCKPISFESISAICSEMLAREDAKDKTKGKAMFDKWPMTTELYLHWIHKSFYFAMAMDKLLNLYWGRFNHLAGKYYLYTDWKRRLNVNLLLSIDWKTQNPIFIRFITGWILQEQKKSSPTIFEVISAILHGNIPRHKAKYT